MTNLINKLTKLAMIPIIAVGLNGCKYFSIKKEKGPVEYLLGSDNSTFLLENIKEGIYDFNFYRDKNNDGIADTKGKGFYLYKNGINLPKFTEEEMILKYEMKTLSRELCNKYFSKKVE